MLTHERLLQLLTYDSESGVFTWNINRKGGARAKDVAGANMVNGYRSIGLDGKRYYAHRLAWLYTYGVWPPTLLDHRNHDRRDNRLRNLRIATNQGNSQNMTPATTNHSGLRGVCYDKARGKWSAKITVSAKTINLGRFDTKAAAHEAYLEAKAKHHPFYNSEGEAHHGV